MVSDSNPGPSDPPASHPERPRTTTPVNTGSRTLYRFGDALKNVTYNVLYSTLARDMIPYFIGPMPVADFLSYFLPLPPSSSLDDFPSFTKGMFKSVLAQTDEAGMYLPFINALNPHLSNLQIYCTSNSDERGKTDFPTLIKPDCSVFAKEHAFRGTDSSAVELFIELKRHHADDPFVIKSRSDNSNAAPPESGNPFMKLSQDSYETCGQITAYATSHMSAQYRTHVFIVLICQNYARLIRWDRSGAIVTEPIYYDEASELFDFFIRLDRSPPEVRGQDTTVGLASSEETEDAVKAVKELKELETPLLVVSVPDAGSGKSSRYVVAPPFASPWVPVGRWTRTSIGYDIRRKRTILMKDSWRVVLDGVPKEGDVYSKFEANGVPNVPRCSNSGDIGEDTTYHSTQTDRFCHYKSFFSRKHDFTQHRHYRLILDDIGEPLESFKCSRDMVRAVRAALVAHKFAYKCGILHRDISSGNILITSDKRFEGGLLIDWDLSKDINSPSDTPRRAARTGTWQFMAADLVLDPTTGHRFVHDLESAFYVILWLAVRFLPNSWNPTDRGHVMVEVFDPPTEGSHTKKNWMAASSSRLTGTQKGAGPKRPFKIANNEVLPALIISLSRFFQARYLEVAEPDPNRLDFGPEDAKTTPVNAGYVETMLRHLEDHEQIIRTFDKALNVSGVQWPEEEPATKQRITKIEREGQYHSSRSMKRSQSRSGIGSSQKRLRMVSDDL